MNIIFLDIDGPMIPATSFLFNKFASWEQILDERCVKVLHKIVQDFDAQIVFNTTHNRMLYGKGDSLGPGLIAKFEEAGFKNYIHKHNHTEYPGIARLDAIHHWLYNYGNKDTQWVAFDDVELDDEKAYTTDYDLGIGIGEYNHAAHYFAGKPFLYL